MSSNLPLLPALVAPSGPQQHPAPSSSDAEDGESTSGSDASREADDDGREPTDVARAHPTPPSVVPASVIIPPVDDDVQDMSGESPQTRSDGEEPMEEILAYDDGDEADATVRYITHDEGDELDYDRSEAESEEAVDIDIAGLTTQLRSDEASRKSDQGGGAGSGSGGGGGSSGGGGGGSGGSGTDAFQTRTKNPLERRSGTGNGSKKGKGWRAAALPAEIIERILTLVYGDLLQVAYADLPSAVSEDEITLSGCSKRNLLAHLQIRFELLQFRLVAKTWKTAVDRSRFWFSLAWRVYGDRVRGMYTNLAQCRSWLSTQCLVCAANGYEHNFKVVAWEPSHVGRIPCCKIHKSSFCYRCLFGPWSPRLDGHEDRTRCVLQAEGDADFFGDDNPLSCRYCREEILGEELVQRRVRQFSHDDLNDAGRDPAIRYLLHAEGDAAGTVTEMVERRWLARNTKFAEILEQALQSYRFARPDKKPRDANDLAAIRRALRGQADGDDEDDMSTLDEDDYDEFESDEDEEDDDSLSRTELVQVAEMALHACLSDRVVHGYWLSPAEQHIVRMQSPNRKLEHTFAVVQPHVPLFQPTRDNQAHLPYHTRDVPVPLPSKVGSLLESSEFVYAGALRTIIFPAMEQIVRLVSQVRDPIRLASAYSAVDILTLLRLPGAWVPGGLDYLVPHEREREARRASISSSTRSSISSDTSVKTPPVGGGSSGQQSRRQSDVEGRQSRDPSPFIGPRPPADHLPAARDAPSPMQSVSSHSPSPSTTNPSVSTPPSSTSPPPPSAHPAPPPSPRKQSTVLLPNPAQLPPPPPASAPLLPPLPSLPPIAPLVARPIHPIPCIPMADASLSPVTLNVIQQAWYSAWEPLRLCHCAICLRGMGFPAQGQAQGGSASEERNGNGKRKGEDEDKGGGLVRVGNNEVGAGDDGGVPVGLGLGLTGSDDDGSVKRARTDTA